MQDPMQTESDSFFAGILHHLRAVCAFSLPLDASYDRVCSGMWSGGEYVCWGWQNRETPLRRISQDRFEVKTVCGTANPYLALSALLAAGLDGLRRNLRLTMIDCQQDPAKLSDSERLSLGIDQRLPASVEESLEILEQDSPLRETIGVSLVAAYSAVTRAWNQQLRTMNEHERHEFLIRNY
jgi:glutamine synthetase